MLSEALSRCLSARQKLGLDKGHYITVLAERLLPPQPITNIELAAISATHIKDATF